MGKGDAHNDHMNESINPHRPIAPFHAFQEGTTILLIAACSCGGDCAMTAAVMPDAFFTPDGDQGTR